MGRFVEYSRGQALRGSRRSCRFRRARGYGYWSFGGFTFAAVAAATTATTPAFFVGRIGRFTSHSRGSLLETRFNGRRRRLGGSGSNFGGRGFNRVFSDRRCGFRSCKIWRGQHKIAGRMGGIHGRYFRAKPDGCFLRFRFPIGSAKTISGSEIPFSGFGILPGRFEIAGKLKRNHRVAGFFVQIRKLPDGILAGAGPTNTGGDLFPISHVLACIVAAEARYSQHRRAVGGRRFFSYKGD